LPEKISYAQQTAEAPIGPLRGKALHMFHMYEGLYPEGPSQHAQKVFSSYSISDFGSPDPRRGAARVWISQ